MTGWLVACPRDGPATFLLTNRQLGLAGLGEKEVELMID